MSNDFTTPERVSRSYFRSHQDPVRCAKEILAVWMIRDPDTHPTAPLRGALDRAAVHHMGWRFGDAITLVPIGLDRALGEGKLIIRKGRPGEMAFILDEINPNLAADNSDRCSAETHGPHFEWCFPAEWVETFFPGIYFDDDHDFNSQTERRWRLIDLLEQEDRIELVLDASELFLYLQRTSSTPKTLDLHLVPGLFHLKDWSRKSPLVLESASGFDPDSTSDTLTIREPCLGEEPNLLPTSGGHRAEVNPRWLDRFLPDVYDPSGATDRASPQELDPEAAPDHPGFEFETYRPTEYRDTFVVCYSEMTTTKHTLGFEIPQPRLK